ncbi:hypothetical protein PAMP_016060 [Pampus punctatissimus]
MSVNSSSLSNSSIYSLGFPCINSSASMLFFIVLNMIRGFVILPLCILILYLGYQQWRQQRSFSKMSHSDIFTYHMVAIELIWVLSCGVFLYGFFTNIIEVMKVGFCFGTISYAGQLFFHILTCVERYLAVVHPIIYLRFRNSCGVRIRNVSIGCVWLLCFGYVGITFNKFPAAPIIPLSCLLVSSSTIVSFCNLSVLCVLLRQGPGDRGRDKVHVDQSKKRAFLNTLAIMGVMWLWFVGFLVYIVLNMSSHLSYSVVCLISNSASLINLPSSVVLPLLYLHRAGKISCCCVNSE